MNYLGWLNENSSPIIRLINNIIPFINSDAFTPIINKVKKGYILNPRELEQVADFIRVIRLLVRLFCLQVFL